VYQDEVLAHRLGLLPVLADPRLFDYPTKLPPGAQLDTIADPKSTLVFELSVKCERPKKKKSQAAQPGQPGQQGQASQPPVPAANEVVYSSKLVWHPIGDQVRRSRQRVCVESYG